MRAAFSLATGLDRLITHNGERSIIVVYIHALLFPTFHFPECFLLRARVELKIEWIVEIFSIYFPSRHKKFSERSMNELKFVLPPEVCCDREVKDASKMNISIKKSALTSLLYMHMDTNQLMSIIQEENQIIHLRLSHLHRAIILAFLLYYLFSFATTLLCVF